MASGTDFFTFSGHKVYGPNGIGAVYGKSDALEQARPYQAGVLAFKLDGHEDGQVGQYLDRFGIAVRTGHHCAQPVLRRFGLESAVRPVLGLYNSFEDIDTLVKVLHSLARK